MRWGFLEAESASLHLLAQAGLRLSSGAVLGSPILLPALSHQVL